MFGVVNDTDFEAQLEELKNGSSKRATVVSIDRGRGNKKEVPTELKKVISEESILGSKAKELSNTFGVSESSVSAYKNDATSTASYNEPNDELKKHNENVRDGIVNSARGKLLLALESITEEKLELVKVRDAAGIAKDMSAVIKNMEPSADRNGTILNQQIVFHAPHPKKESDFDVVEVRD